MGQVRAFARLKNAASPRGAWQCLGRRAPDARHEKRPLRHGDRVRGDEEALMLLVLAGVPGLHEAVVMRA